MDHSGCDRAAGKIKKGCCKIDEGSSMEQQPPFYRSLFSAFLGRSCWVCVRCFSFRLRKRLKKKSRSGTRTIPPMLPRRQKPITSELPSSNVARQERKKLPFSRKSRKLPRNRKAQNIQSVNLSKWRMAFRLSAEQRK